MGKGVTMVIGRMMDHQHLEHGVHLDSNILFTSWDLEHASTFQIQTISRRTLLGPTCSGWTTYPSLFCGTLRCLGGNTTIP